MLRIAFTCIVLAVLALSFDWRTAWQQAEFHSGWFVAALAVYVLSQVMSAVRWHGLLLAGRMAYPLSQVARRYFEGVFFNLCLPTAIGGDVWKAYSLGESAKRRLVIGASVLVDRLFGLAALLVILAGAVIYRNTASLLLMGLCSTVLVLLIPLAFTALRSIARVVETKARPGRMRSACEKLNSMDTSMAAQFRAFILSLGIQGANVVTVGLLCKATAFDVGWAMLCWVVPLTILMTLLPLSVGGVGIREGGFAVLLSGVASSPEAGVSLGFLWTVVMTLTSCVGGIVYLCGRQTQPEDCPAGEANEAVQSEVSLG